MNRVEIIDNRPHCTSYHTGTCFTRVRRWILFFLHSDAQIKDNRKPRFGALFCLGVGLCCGSAIWLVRWFFRHFRSQSASFDGQPRTSSDDFGTLLLLFWIIWFVLMARAACLKTNAVLKTEQVRAMFRHLKFTFTYAQLAFFIRACWHPELGFVQGQLELTIINLMLPVLYVFLLIFFRSLTLIEKKTVVWGVPLSLLASITIYLHSDASSPYAICMVFTFLFGRIIAAFCDYSTRTQLAKANPFLRRQKSQPHPEDVVQDLPGQCFARGFVRLGLHLLVFGGRSLSGFKRTARLIF